jgi:ferredoxin-NADP reductase
MAPAGKFYIAVGDMPVVLIGAGIGITPMMCMLLWCLEHQPGRKVSLYYGVRNPTEHAFMSVLEDLAERNSQFSICVVYSDTAHPSVFSDKNHYFGQIDVALLKQTLPHGPHQFYVCGPTAMMESLVPALAQWGVPLTDIHFEAFGPASISLVAQQPTANQADALTAQPTLEIRFKASQRSLTWDNQKTNLLDFAESHGIAVESGCRAGSCGCCATPLLSGEVVYEHAPDFELLPGQCLLCVGKPASALVLGL